MDPKVKVSGDGRLHVPRKVTEAAGLSPHEEIDLQDIRLCKRGATRRTFCRLLKTAVKMAAGAGIAKIADIVTIEDHVDAMHADAEKKVRELLRPFWGTGSAESAALLPAAHHPFRPPPDGDICYPTERENCLAYVKRFGSEKIRMVAGKPNVRSDDTVVFFGSQVSNLNARRLFGDPFLDRPTFDIEAGDLTSGWRARLRWNLCSPLTSHELRLLLDGSEWKTHDHFLIDSVTNRTVKPRTTGGHRLEEDYLLVTALPRFATGPQRVLWMSGVHRPAQMSVPSVLLKPPVSELEKMKKAVGSDPYFQALFHVEVIGEEHGRQQPSHDDHHRGLRPGRVTFVDAHSLSAELKFIS